jgi:hypothetical protein
MLNLGARVADPEAITYGGGYYYVVGSQSIPGAANENAIVRFRLDPTTRALQGQPEVLSDLLAYLKSTVSEIGGAQPNIEGAAWDPVGERLLLGFRYPVLGDRALIVPLKLIDPAGPFSLANLARPQAIQIRLAGFGIRDIHFDTKLKAFIIISGTAEQSGKLDFRLWEWNGDQSSDPAPLDDVSLDSEMKPEGVAHVRAGGRDFVFVSGDASRYTKLDYSANTQ